MFSTISGNWRRRSLTTYQTIVQLIGHTRTKTGLKIVADLDRNQYPAGHKPGREAACNPGSAVTF